MDVRAWARVTGKGRFPPSRDQALTIGVDGPNPLCAADWPESTLRRPSGPARSTGVKPKKAVFGLLGDKSIAMTKSRSCSA
jgi:hypothetical protein